MDVQQLKVLSETLCNDLFLIHYGCELLVDIVDLLEALPDEIYEEESSLSVAVALLARLSEREFGDLISSAHASALTIRDSIAVLAEVPAEAGLGGSGSNDAAPTASLPAVPRVKGGR